MRILLDESVPHKVRLLIQGTRLRQCGFKAGQA